MFDSFETDFIQEDFLLHEIDMVLEPDLLLESELTFESDLSDDIVYVDDYDTTDDMANTTIGDPDALECETQIAPDNCAVEAERSIINAFVENPLSQEEAMYISATNGWYQPGVGTPIDVIGQMMEFHGIPNHTVVDATVADLACELSQGHGVIVGVDSAELMDCGPMAELRLWMESTFGIDSGEAGANHAVVVTGIDVSNPTHPMVIINDSGVPNGKGVAYPMEKFLQAWEDSNCHYTATSIPLPYTCLQGSNHDMSLALRSMSFRDDMSDICDTLSMVGSHRIGSATMLAAKHKTDQTPVESTQSLLESIFDDVDEIINL